MAVQFPTLESKVKAGVTKLFADPKFHTNCVGRNYIQTKCVCIRNLRSEANKVEQIKEAMVSWVLRAVEDRIQGKRQVVTDLRGLHGKKVAFWALGQLDDEEEEIQICEHALESLLAFIPGDNRDVKWLFNQVSKVGQDFYSGGQRHRVAHRLLFKLAMENKVSQLDEIVKGEAKKRVEVKWKDIYEQHKDRLVETGLLRESDTYEAHGKKLSQKFNEFSLNKMTLLHEGFMKFPDSPEKQLVDSIGGCLRTVSDDLKRFFKDWATALPKGGVTDQSNNVIYQKDSLVYQLYADGTLESQLLSKKRQGLVPRQVQDLAQLPKNKAAMKEFDSIVKATALEMAKKAGNDDLDESKFVCCYKVSHLVTTEHKPQDAHFDLPAKLREHCIGFWPMTEEGMFLEFWPGEGEEITNDEEEKDEGTESDDTDSNEEEMTEDRKVPAVSGKQETNEEEGLRQTTEEVVRKPRVGVLIFLPYGQMLFVRGNVLHGGSYLGAKKGHVRGHLYLFLDLDKNPHPFSKNYYPINLEDFWHLQELEFMPRVKKPSTLKLHATQGISETYGYAGAGSRRTKKIKIDPKYSPAQEKMARPSASLGRSFFGYEYTVEGEIYKPGRRLDAEQKEERHNLLAEVRKEKEKLEKKNKRQKK